MTNEQKTDTKSNGNYNLNSQKGLTLTLISHEVVKKKVKKKTLSEQDTGSDLTSVR